MTKTERESNRHDVELLAILTGLEIDSAKSGVKPDLSAYLESGKTKKSLFLQYKAIIGNTERKWYQPTAAKRVKEFIEKTDWSTVSSNLEKLPYYAYMLYAETEKHNSQPVQDSQLFAFAETDGWQDQLDRHILERTKSIIFAYREALSRMRHLHHIPMEMKRKTDIERILYARGQESRYSVDELYHAFDNIQSQDIRQARIKLTEMSWHLTPPSDRLIATYSIIGDMLDYEYRELFCDFRHGGYRILGDIICDLDDMYRSRGISKSLIRSDDSNDIKRLLVGVRHSSDYKQVIIRNCLYLFKPNTKGEEIFDLNEALKCAVALGERQFALEVMPMMVLENCRRVSFDK